MRVIRNTGQNVSPSDDGRLYDKAFIDGLFNSPSITSLGANLVQIGSMYGILCGRDFTADAQQINVELPTADTATGYIYIKYDTATDDIITIESALAPFTVTYEDINTSGTVCEMIIATYTASQVAVTSLTANYPTAQTEINNTLAGSIATIETSPATANHSVGEYIVYNGQLYKVTSAITAGQSLAVGTNIIATNIADEFSSATTATLLWEGNFTGTGSITVDGLSDWLVVGYSNTENNLYLLTGSTARGGGLYGGYDSASIATMAYRFGESGNTLTVDSANRGIYFENTTTYSGGTNNHIRKIYGIVKKPS